MSAKMTKYKHADFTDEDSIGSVQLTEGISASATHIRYHTGSSMWRRRSMLEKCLLVLVGTLLFVVVVLAILLNSADNTIHEARLKSASNPPPCLNETCIRISDEILSSMDRTVDPCEDFYSYACDGWIRSNPLPDGQASWSTFSKLEQRNLLVIKRVLDRPIGELKSKAEQKAKLYYESCMDANETVESLGAKPMLELLKKIGGSWDLNATEGYALDSSWSLQKLLEPVQNKYNVEALFSYAVDEDDRNSSRHVLQVDQSSLALPTRDYYLNQTEHGKVVTAYLEYMTKVGVLLGGEENATRAAMAEVLKFETRLANITTPKDQRRDEETLYNLMTIRELQERAGFIDWRAFFENAMKTVNHKVTAKENVVVYAPDYLGNLTALISEYNKTEDGKIVLNNYLIWRTVHMYAGYLSRPFRDAIKGFRKVLVGSEGAGEVPQWRFCVSDTNTVLGFAVGAIFVREVFDNQLITRLEQMIEDVKKAFKENLKKVVWMDSETLKAAEDKADAISDMIGYPDFINDPKQLDERYSNLTVRKDSYFDNNLNSNFYSLVKNLEKIDKPVNKSSWSMMPSTVNAYYSPSRNQMVFLAGILQSPFYNLKYPLSLNYGSMGVVMGHELTHGFDDQGREFDRDGNLHRWWKNETVTKFKKKADCFAEQYSKFEINGKRLNGNQTLGENIADNGGVKTAYRAFLERSRTEAPPPRLPGIDLTDNQLFFLAFAQVWCTTTTKEAAELNLLQDPHSPARFRVVAPLMNLREFADEFGCAPGSKMNPRDRCELW